MRTHRFLPGRRALAAIAALAIAASAGVAAPPADFVGPVVTENLNVWRFTLDNGLHVILRRVDPAPYATLVVLYNTGDAHDPPGLSGLGRLMNRVYVTAAAGDLRARTIEEWRGRYLPPKGVNALVGEDFFVIGTMFDAADLEREIIEAATRMRDLRPTQADIDRERPSVLEAIRSMNGGSPPSGAFTTLREMLEPSAPDARWGGIPDQVMTISEKDAVNYAAHLKPGNAIISLVGQFDETEARRLITEHFGPIPRGRPAPPRAQVPAPRFGETQRITIETEQGQWHGRTLLTMGFRAPPPGDPSYPTWQVLIGYLYRWMTNPESAPGGASAISPVQVQYRTVEDPAMLQVAAVLNVGANEDAGLAQLRRFVDRAIDTIDRSDAVDLEPARGAFSVLGLADASEESMIENLYGVAFGMARIRQMGLGDGGRLIADFENVTLDDLRRAAAKYFGPDNAATVIMRAAAPGAGSTP